MNRAALLVWLTLAACGRIGFDTLATANDAVDGTSGGRPAASCEDLAPTCGPTGTSPCCESPVVTGGTYARSYDVSGDAMFANGSNLATVGDFRLDKYEVTVGRFRQFIAAGKGTQTSAPSEGAGAHAKLAGSGWDPGWSGSLAPDTAGLVAALSCHAFATWTNAPGGNESRPINCVNWYEAMAFCVWDGGYLPTEAEWNYAAAGGAAQRAYPWSSPASSLANDDSTYASYFVDATRQCLGDGANGCTVTDLVPVGSKPLGDGAWGQSDLAGNVREWVLDWFAGYDVPCDDCANLIPASARLNRGGSLYEDTTLIRSGYRNGGTPDTHGEYLGVRCARTP